MTLPENTAELVEEELKTLLQLIERHLDWAKSPDSADLARLNIVAAESLIEAARLVRSLCERLNDESG